MFNNNNLENLYKKGRKKFQTTQQIPKGVIDPLIIQDLDDDSLIEDPMFWHLIDVWRWLIKFDGALSRCSTLTRREQDLCRNFEKKRITNPYASIYASKFITYLLVNKWMIVGSDKPEVMIGLIQVLILIVSNFAFDDSSYQKLAEIGIPIKGFPILAALAVIKQSDPGYGYFLQELRKKKIDETKFNFVKATNFVVQKIFNEWAKKVDNMKIKGEKTVVRDDDEDAQLAFGDGINLTDVNAQFVNIIKDNLNKSAYFSGSDIFDLIKGKTGAVEGTRITFDFSQSDALAQFNYSSFFTAYLTQFLVAVTGNNWISLDRAQLKDISSTSPPPASDYPQIDFSDILKVGITLKFTIQPGTAQSGQNSVKITPPSLNSNSVVIAEGQTEYVIVPDSVEVNSIDKKTYNVTYSWTNKMDLFSRTLLTQFEPSAIKQIVDLSNEKAFALLLALFAQSGTKPKGLDQLKKTVKTYREMMTMEDDDESDYKKLKREARAPWGDSHGYRKKSRSGGRRKSRSGGRGGRKKRSYGRRH